MSVFVTIKNCATLSNIHANRFYCTSSINTNTSDTFDPLEINLKKKLLSYACDHYIFELLITNLFAYMYRELHGLLMQQYLNILMNIVDTLTQNSTNREFHLALLHIYYMIQIKTQTSFQKYFLRQTDIKLRRHYKEILELIIFFLDVVPAR